MGPGGAAELPAHAPDIGGWVKKKKGGRVLALGLDEAEANSFLPREVFDYQRFAPKPEWQTFSFVLQAKDTAATGTQFQIRFNGTGKLWLANVRLAQIPDPTVGHWLDGFYLMRPVEWDDAHRFFGW